MEEDKERIVLCSIAIIEAYNVQDMAEMEKWCKIIDGYMKKHPTYFTKTKHPLIVSFALFYAIREGFCQGDNAIVVTYYSLLKTIRNSLSKPDDVVIASMLAFVFLEEHKAIIGMKVIENNFSQNYGTNVRETVIHQIIGQLSVFYWSFANSDNKHISLDTLTMLLLNIAVSKYRNKLSGTDADTRGRVTHFIMENFDVMLQNLEIYWEDVEEDDFF